MSSGRTGEHEYFVGRVVGGVGIEWRHNVQIDRALLRRSDIRYGSGDPSRASRLLGWRATRQVDDVIEAAGLGGKRHFYHYFKSKEALGFEVLNWTF